MATVYCLQHTSYRDRTTGVEFAGCEPTELRTETDEVGRETTYIGHSVATVDDEEALDYFRARPWMFHVVGDGEAASEPAHGPHRVEHRAGPWYDVVDEDGGRVNDKALQQDEAEALRDELNDGGE